MSPIEPNQGITCFSVNYYGNEISYFSMPGLPNWDCISPSQRLLFENINLQPGSSVFILGCGHGAHVLALACRFNDSQFYVSDSNGIALELLNKSLQVNPFPNISISYEISLFPGKSSVFDYVILDLPKGRKLSRRWLLEAYLTLKPDGILFLAGANDQGIHSIANDGADLFNQHAVIALKKGNRLIRFKGKKPQITLASWSRTSGIYPGTWIEFNTMFRNQPYQFKTLPGVFASDGLDPGTAFLLDHLEIKKTGRILDFGCGCGVIGVVIAKNNHAWVDMIDINRYAISAASENIRCFEIRNCEAFYSNGLETVMQRKYDQIVTNPPFHSGKAIDYSMTQSLIAQSVHVLASGGELCLVANKFIRYDRILKDFYKDYDAIISTPQYTIWIARNA
jgi:16S rRNA (guanine1207-N2)-methyltransferase